MTKPSWALVVDFYGSSIGRDFPYRVYAFPFPDGHPFNPLVLDAVLPMVVQALARGPVLLHCKAGLSRSASAAYAVLRAHDGLSHEEALARVKAHPAFPMAITLNSARAWVREQPRAEPASLLAARPRQGSFLP